MRTTIDLEDRLYRELKRRASEEGVSMKALVHDLIRRGLAPPKRREKYRFEWKVDPLGTIQPGVRLNDRESLFDLMDGR
jgi:hypothetical protein